MSGANAVLRFPSAVVSVVSSFAIELPGTMTKTRPPKPAFWQRTSTEGTGIAGSGIVTGGRSIQSEDTPALVAVRRTRAWTVRRTVGFAGVSLSSSTKRGGKVNSNV